MEQSNKEGKLPDWMYSQEAYAPSKDKDAFITKSTKSLLTVFGRIHFTEGKDGRFSASSSLKLFYTLIYIIITASSRNALFVLIMCAAVTLRLAFFPAASIRQILSGTISAILLSAFILLPSIFMGNPQTLVNITCRVYVSVTLIGILSAGTSWNKLTRSLRNFHVPSLFIFTLDITLKYISLLGEVCTDILTSVRLRSVGKNPQKAGAVWNSWNYILKSEEMADEMHAAMYCEDLREIIQCLLERIVTYCGSFYIVILLGCIGLFFYLNNRDFVCYLKQ